VTRESEEIIEGDYHAIYYSRIDKAVITKAINRETSRRSAGLKYKSSLCNLHHPKIWSEAANVSFHNKDDNFEHLFLFKNKLSTSSLPTPYIKGKWTPGLYDTTSCELCQYASKPDEYHYLCECSDPTIQQSRLSASDTLFNLSLMHLRV
jgi:hypothetical protein